MTVQLYTGIPGSGKSYHGVKDVIEWASYKLVVANFMVKDLPDVSLDKKGRAKGFLYIPDAELSLERLLAIYHEHLKHQHRESRALLIVDEAQRLFNTREWQAPDRKRWVTFFSLHRHLGFDVVLVAQDKAIIDAQVLAMCAEEVRHRKVNRHFPFSLFPMAVFACVTSQMHTRLKGELSVLILKRKVANRYDSLHEFAMGELAALVGVEGAAKGKDRESAGTLILPDAKPGRGRQVGAPAAVRVRIAPPRPRA